MKRIEAYMARYAWRRFKALFVLPQRLYYETELLRVMVARLDSYTIRFALAIGSILWAIGQIPTGNFDPFGLHGYEVLRMFGPSWMWASLFVLHACLVGWRLRQLADDTDWDRLVNSFGFCLWSFTTLMFNIALHRLTSGTAMEWTMVFLSGFALARSGVVTPPVAIAKGSVKQ